VEPPTQFGHPVELIQIVEVVRLEGAPIDPFDDRDAFSGACGE